MLLKLISLLGPMVLLIGLGYLCRRKNTFSPEEIGGLKKLVARVLLPFLVFTSFATVELEVHTLLLPLLSALIFLGAFGMGKLCRTLPGIYGEYTPLWPALPKQAWWDTGCLPCSSEKRAFLTLLSLMRGNP